MAIRVGLWLAACFLIPGVFSSRCSSTESLLYASDSWQELKSPGYDTGGYSDGMDCRWRIVPRDRNKIVSMETQDLQLEEHSRCSYDYLEVSDETGVKGKFCGKSDRPTIQSSQGSLGIKFHTDSSNTDRGFRIRYKQMDYGGEPISSQTIQTCSELGITVTAQSTERYIESVNYPAQYSKNLNCKWTLRTWTDNYVIKVVVMDSSLESSSSCSWDYVAAYDGMSTGASLLQKWCGTQQPTVYSNGQHLTLHFHTDSSNSQRGFRLGFKEVPEAERSSGGLSSGAIAGIVVACVLAILFVFCCCCISHRHNSAKATNRGAAGTGRNAAAGNASGATNAANRQVFFTTTSYPNSNQVPNPNPGPDPSTFAPPVYPGPSQPYPMQSPVYPGQSPAYPGQSPAYPVGYTFPQPSAPSDGSAPPYPLQREPSFPKEPPPPYWMASQYAISPGDKVDTPQSGGAGQGGAADSGTGENTSGTTQGNASGVSNAGFVPDGN